MLRLRAHLRSLSRLNMYVFNTYVVKLRHIIISPEKRKLVMQPILFNDGNDNA